MTKKYEITLSADALILFRIEASSKKQASKKLDDAITKGHWAKYMRYQDGPLTFFNDQCWDDDELEEVKE
jgi:hypothetical protein